MGKPERPRYYITFGDECGEHSQDFPACTCWRLYFQVQLIKWVCSRRSHRGIQSTNAHPGLPSRGQMMSLPMGSSESQKPVFMSWENAFEKALRTLESSRIIDARIPEFPWLTKGVKKSKGLFCNGYRWRSDHPCQCAVWQVEQSQPTANTRCSPGREIAQTTNEAVWSSAT